MSDPIARMLAEREALDRGLPATLVMSLSGHVLLLGAAVLVPWLMPAKPPIQVAEFAVVLPRGGGGSQAAPAPPSPAQEAKPQPVESAAPPPAPAVLKPPKEAPRPNALPLPNARATKKPPTPPPVRPTTRSSAAPPAASSTTPGTTPGARGASSATPGLEFGPPGPGVPTGTDSGGDWYLAAVQQKIWMIWNQQLKSGYTQSVSVTFTIMPDGSVTGVRVTQSSGTSLLDLAAQRAIFNAQPFGPLPREYGQKPRTIEAVFRPS